MIVGINPPPPGCLKVNIDVAMRATFSVVATVLSDDSGKVGAASTTENIILILEIEDNDLDQKRRS
jgi:hypothetical protein